MADVLIGLDVESLGPEKHKDKHDFTTTRKLYCHVKKRTFATFVASKKLPPSSGSVWICCGQTFTDSASVHRHVSNSHTTEIRQLTTDSLELQQTDSDSVNLQQTDSDSVNLQQTDSDSVNLQQTDSDSVKWTGAAVSSWMPDVSRVPERALVSGPGEVLLFYCYCPVRDPHIICQWQKELCSTLQLTGKVRVATEGINGTVGGTRAATDLYIEAMLSHPTFRIMQTLDFKRSEGGAECFPDLRVGVHREIVPMGVDPEVVSYRSAGVHLEPQEFHAAVKALLERPGDSDTVLLDCRNFYESRIGQFSRCLAPDIRKFSYFPDYVDKNLDLFRDKRVLMYCTGGIRCERGSAYLRSKNVCKEVYQLKGGIHKYLEQFPDGFYRGKLFVFDERYAISFNHDIISECRYCGRPWDHYELCSSASCCQLVLSCPSCRERRLTACCPVCQDRPEHSRREECQCTASRPRIPCDTEHT